MQKNLNYFYNNSEDSLCKNLNQCQNNLSNCLSMANTIMKLDQIFIRLNIQLQSQMQQQKQLQKNSLFSFKIV
ncbi:hypothetical protein TTHERM_000810562 (macronuclear) [Tetrahymena thermophila SB210]|uniref:Uncharacterized protein n=1 Tax=Tetrahymena thermophila (strain SB210) TaxID=312017 RepID=W7XGS5_TETTS|nr:hypothetical protein TTHERM_000810562 [Tetrahymena thermophila SB210]EWS76248.1 hypothetical protein TTHERM_000810562 [Tetrahymena thermophila SB210]|eukprot:XP_012651207.1 hypothetical protein TTHERM_000810562 [Tetrahymena thermophila SB210]